MRLTDPLTLAHIVGTTWPQPEGYVAVGGKWSVSRKPRTHRKMRKLETPNMMKVIPVPSATIARVESGAEGERGTLRKTVCEF